VQQDVGVLILRPQQKKVKDHSELVKNIRRGDTVVTSPVYSGSTYALAGTPTDSDYAQCSQVVSVQPSSSYSLSGWVEGDYVYLGETGAGTSDADDWTPSAPSWTELSSSFTTGSATTSVTIYVNGWYAQPEFYADDLSLTGPAGSGGC